MTTFELPPSMGEHIVFYEFAFGPDYTHPDSRATRRAGARRVEQQASRFSLGRDFVQVHIDVCDVLGDPVRMAFGFSKDPGHPDTQQALTDKIVKWTHGVFFNGPPEKAAMTIVRPVEDFTPSVESSCQPDWAIREMIYDKVRLFACRRSLGAAFMEVEVPEDNSCPGEVIFTFADDAAEENESRVTFLKDIVKQMVLDEI